MRRPLAVLALLFTGSAAQAATRTVDLPGATDAGVMMDYLAYDSANHRAWVPAGNTGAVDVVDAADLKIHQVTGFKTAEMERNGHKRTVGPSSATVGEGLVFVGNRGDSSVCAVDAKTLVKGPCVTLDSSPDGLQWIAALHEVWVTTPRNQSIVFLEVKPGALTVKGKLTVEGQPEGFAVDNAHGIFFTNLEDKDRTLAIDLKTRKVVSTWMPACGEDGPKGLAFDPAQDVLLLACTQKVEALDAAHGGKILSSLEVGEGVDNIDFVAARKQLFVGASRAGKLTVATLGPGGKLTVDAAIPTGVGTRNPVAGEDGRSFLSWSAQGKLVVVDPVPAVH